MEEVIVLGAGASAGADLPTSVELTERIYKELASNENLRPYAEVVSFVHGGLKFHQGVVGENSFNGVDVEALVSAVQLLAERHQIEAAPFIGSWHRRIDELDEEPAPQIPYKIDAFREQMFRTIVTMMLERFPLDACARGKEDIDAAVARTTARGAGIGPAGDTVPSVSGNESVGQAIAKYLQDVLSHWLDQPIPRRALSLPPITEQLGRAFAAVVTEVQRRPGKGRIFHETADAMVRALVRILWIRDPERVAYLAPLLKPLETKTKNRLVIVSLNYDNAVELLAEHRGIPCHTGIETWSEKGELAFEDEGLILLKLHGSIDWKTWRQVGNASSENWERLLGSGDAGMPQQRIRRLSPTEMESGKPYRPALIFGQRNKLTASGPYLDLLRAFKDALARASIVTVIGYSFRDEHVNEYLSQWLNGDSSRRLRIINRSFSKLRVPYVNDLRVFAASRIDVIENDVAVALRDLWGTS